MACYLGQIMSWVCITHEEHGVRVLRTCISIPLVCRVGLVGADLATRLTRRVCAAEAESDVETFPPYTDAVLLPAAAFIEVQLSIL